MELDNTLKYITGVGPKRAEMLEKQLGITTVGQLLTYYPYKYIDRSKFYRISECVDDASYVQFHGVIRSFEVQGTGPKQRLIAKFTDGSGIIDLVWFQGLKYVKDRLRVNVEYIVFGKPTFFRDIFNIVHPDIDPYTPENLKRNSGLQAFYNTTETMKRMFLNSEAIRKIVYNILQDPTINFKENIPAEIISRLGLMGVNDSIRQIHRPTSNELLKRAQFRLKFEELFYIQLMMLRSAQLRMQRYEGYRFERVGEYFNRFYNEFMPFPLTGAQKRVIKEIRNDMNTGRQMNRLLQGDVGSGKTMVAMLTALIALDNGFQVCIMAPTEILANQHYESISSQLKPLGIEVRLLTGSVKGKRRQEILDGLADGMVNIVIGTHALIEDNVVFRNLGYCVIDEQHRFGVAQRAKLWTKSKLPPHVLVMTATPIPRTLAMTVYGDLEVSVIDELPPGRKPVATYHYYDNARQSLYAFIHKQIAAGRQVYVVYPLVKESEKIDLKNVEEGYNQMMETFPECEVVMVHGQMKVQRKDEMMERFVSGKARIMVATTVIEVGVNVPNASVMVIENAERFGLSQLHQLRGRVGRGADQSYCILMSKYELAKETRQRLSIMCTTNDGFVIAEEDMRLRGPGDMEGLQQSGLPFDLKIASLATDGLILNIARDEAKKIIAAGVIDSDEYASLRNHLKMLESKEKNWGSIS